MNDNSNNMDDLFKRAADDYPLRTDSADWDKILGAMDQDDMSLIVPPYEQDDRRRRRRFLWVLLLLPLGGLGYYAFHNGHTSVQKSVASGQAAGKSSDNSMGGASGFAGSTGRNASDDVKANKEKIVLDEIKAGKEKEDNRDKMPENVKAGKEVTTIGNDGRNTRSGKVEKRRGSMKAGKAATVAGTSYEGKENSNPGTNTGDSKGLQDDRSLQKSRIAGTIPMKSGISLKVDVSANHSGKGVSQPAAKPATRSKNSFFYAGIIVAPDLSFVKFQSVKGVGYTAGILLGYNINRHLALETGLYFDRKKYYTDGEYFNQKNPPPPNYYLENVDGACNMWEIPVNFRYNFGRGEKRKWFATAGLSTYLMTREQYAYNYENTSNGTSWPTTWAGKNSSNYLFSVVNFSAGFEQQLGKIGNLRLEPYLRVPLGGFGKGSLPIMSAGLNVGITRRIK